MPELNWNEADFAACLEVLPEVDEDRTCYAYQVNQSGMQLELTDYPYGSGIYITLYRIGVELPVFEMRLRDSAGARYVQDQRGEFLELAPGQVFGGRFDGESVISYGVRVFAKPSLAIRLFRETP